MKTQFIWVALAAIVAVFWTAVMADNARLLLNPSADSLGDSGLSKGWLTLRFQNVAKSIDYSIGASR